MLMLKSSGCDCDLTCSTKPTLHSSELLRSGFFFPLLHHLQPHGGLSTYDLLQLFGSGFPWWVKCLWEIAIIWFFSAISLTLVTWIGGWGAQLPLSSLQSTLIMTASFRGADSDNKSEASNLWSRRTATCSDWGSHILWYAGLLSLFVSHFFFLSNKTFHTILNLLHLLLALCYSGYICASSLPWPMSSHGLQSTAQHQGSPWVLPGSQCLPSSRTPCILCPKGWKLPCYPWQKPIGLISTCRLYQPQSPSGSLCSFSHLKPVLLKILGTSPLKVC